jgi:hypothetical protein
MHLAHAQRRLKELGYDATGDGVVNQKNRDAMRRFQERNGLEPTGLLDAPTEQKLLSAEAVKAETAADEPPAAVTAEDTRGLPLASVDARARRRGLTCSPDFFTHVRRAPFPGHTLAEPASKMLMNAIALRHLEAHGERRQAQGRLCARHRFHETGVKSMKHDDTEFWQPRLISANTTGRTPRSATTAARATALGFRTGLGYGHKLDRPARNDTDWSRAASAGDVTMYVARIPTWRLTIAIGGNRRDRRQGHHAHRQRSLARKLPPPELQGRQPEGGAGDPPRCWWSCDRRE